MVWNAFEFFGNPGNPWQICLEVSSRYFFRISEILEISYATLGRVCKGDYYTSKCILEYYHMFAWISSSSLINKNSDISHACMLYLRKALKSCGNARKKCDRRKYRIKDAPKNVFTLTNQMTLKYKRKPSGGFVCELFTAKSKILFCM